MGIFPSEKEKLKPKIGFPVLRLQFFLNYIPPENVMEESLERSLEAKLGRVIADEILEQNHYDDQVAAVMPL